MYNACFQYTFKRSFTPFHIYHWNQEENLLIHKDETLKYLFNIFFSIAYPLGFYNKIISSIFIEIIISLLQLIFAHHQNFKTLIYSWKKPLNKNQNFGCWKRLCRFPKNVVEKFLSQGDICSELEFLSAVHISFKVK